MVEIYVEEIREWVWRPEQLLRSRLRSRRYCYCRVDDGCCTDCCVVAMVHFVWTALAPRQKIREPFEMDCVVGDLPKPRSDRAARNDGCRVVAAAVVDFRRAAVRRVYRKNLPFGVNTMTTTMMPDDCDERVIAVVVAAAETRIVVVRPDATRRVLTSFWRTDCAVADRVV